MAGPGPPGVASYLRGGLPPPGELTLKGTPMADLEKTIQIIFYGDDQIGKTITGISRNLDSLGSKAASATQPPFFAWSNSFSHSV